MVTDLKMENEIKLTIIATGFPSTENLQDREDHAADILREALDSNAGQLDIPPFLRRHVKSRQSTTTPERELQS